MPRNNRPRGLVTIAAENRLTYAQTEEIVEAIAQRLASLGGNVAVERRLTTAARKLRNTLDLEDRRHAASKGDQDYWQARVDAAREKKKSEMEAKR